MDTLTATPPEVSSVIDLERDYLLQNYARYPIVLTRGKGPYVWDTNGREVPRLYLRYRRERARSWPPQDHESDPRPGREADSQLESLLSRIPGTPRETACRRSGLQRVFFSNSGTESMEGALKMIRLHGNHISSEKYEIIRSKTPSMVAPWELFQ